MGLAYLSTNGQNVMDCGNHARVIYCCPMMCLEGQGVLQVISGTNVANNFCNPHHKQTEPAFFDEREMQELLKSEGYAKMDIENIPIVSNPH